MLKYERDAQSLMSNFMFVMDGAENRYREKLRQVDLSALWDETNERVEECQESEQPGAAADIETMKRALKVRSTGRWREGYPETMPDTRSVSGT